MFWFGHHGLGLVLGLGWMLGRGLLTLLFWGAIIALIVLALRSRHEYPAHPQASNSALDVLNARYARGEITKAEYDQIRRDILQ
jgi:putative membrane protein